MIINNFKVYAATTDITSLIQGMTFFESINGLLKGVMIMCSFSGRYTFSWKYNRGA